MGFLRMAHLGIGARTIYFDPGLISVTGVLQSRTDSSSVCDVISLCIKRPSICESMCGVCGVLSPAPLRVRARAAGI